MSVKQILKLLKQSLYGDLFRLCDIQINNSGKKHTEYITRKLIYVIVVQRRWLEMVGSALKIFCEHIEKNFLDDKALKKTAEKLGVPESSLRSWLNYQRTPSIRSLDKIANQIGCLTFQLLRNQPLEIGEYRNNNSNIPLRLNLSKFFADAGCRFMAQKLSLLHHQVTEDMLKSYLRVKDYRIPSLQKLEAMAQALGVETYKLLFVEG